MQPVEYDLLEELSIGDTKMQLCQTMSGKSKVIRIWSSLSNQWNVLYRYGDIEDIWKKWQKLSK